MLVASPQTDPEFDFTDSREMPRRYVIACAPRSGSNLLCELLMQTGKMGCPIEYLHPQSIMVPMARRICGEGEVTGDQYVTELLRRRTSPNGVFGLKTFCWQAKPYIDGRRFRVLFENAAYVYLTRKEKRRQIVSLAIAWQTEQWTSYDKQHGQARYDEDLVHQAGRFLAQEATGWERFFDNHEIEPLRITYEGFLADLDKVGRSVCALVDVTPSHPFRIEQAATKKQSNSVNDDWLEKAERVLSAYV